MIPIRVCKNDGCGDYKRVELLRLDNWEKVKRDCARELYTKEELFAIKDARDMKLYRMPDGKNIEQSHGSSSAREFLIENSEWSLDIFGGEVIRPQDIVLEADKAIMDIQKSLASIHADCDIIGSSNRGIRKDSISSESHIHVGTWVPMIKTDDRKYTKLKGMLLSTESDYEDILTTTRRAQEYIASFRKKQKPTTIFNIQSTLLPFSVACPGATSRNGIHSLYRGVYNLTSQELQQGFIQAVRVWFSFDFEQTITVTKRDGSLGLQPIREEDGWIIARALEGSPCAEAGMPTSGDIYLSHVNGVDVSSLSFPSTHSVQPRNQLSGWKNLVVPLVESSDTCIFTYF